MKKNYFLLFILLPLFFNIGAQVNVVRQLNDPLMLGGKIKAAAKNSNCILVATDGGVFKSTDYGYNWNNATKILNATSVKCEEIVSIGENFYIRLPNSNGMGLYKSSDNGNNWTEIDLPGTTWIFTIGALSNTLYAIWANSSDEGWLYASSDGTDWTSKIKVWTGQYPNKIKLYTFSQNKLFLMIDGELSYTTDGNSFIPITTNGLINADFSEYENTDGDAFGNLYYRDQNGADIYKYDFTSKTWQNITNQIANVNQIVTFSVTDNTIFFSAFDQNFNLKLYKSINQGESFTLLSANGISLPMVENIVETAPNTFIGNSIYYNIYITTDGGENWTSNPNQFVATYAGNLLLCNNTLYLSRESLGAISSDNIGLNWKTFNSGLPNFFGVVYFIRQMIAVRDILFCYVSSSPGDTNVTLYISTNNNTSWLASSFPDYAMYGENYRLVGSCDSLLFVNYYDNNTSKWELLSFSIDEDTWKKVGNGNNRPVCLNGSKDGLFAFYFDNEWDNFDNVYLSNNYGETFTDISQNVINSNQRIKRLYLVENSNGKAFPMMDVDNVNHKALFVTNDGSNIATDKIYKYDLNASSWSEVTTNGLPQNVVMNCLKNIDNNEWLLATNVGLYRSKDGGVSWSIAHSSDYWQNGIIVNSIVKINDKAFLGTMANGVWEVDLSTGIANPLSDKDFFVFPNPATDKLSITIPERNSKPAEITIYNIEGKKVFNTFLTTNPAIISLNHLSAGTYFIELKSDSKTLHKTIVKK